MGKRWTDDEAMRRHDENIYAHGAALVNLNKRMTSLEKWRWFLTGAITVLTTLTLSIGGVVLGNYLILHSGGR